MRKYLGEFEVDIRYTEYQKHTQSDWALYFSSYGQIDGTHHKMWAIDQMVRCLKRTPVIIKERRWLEEDGTIYKEDVITLGKPSKKYLKFVEEYENDEQWKWDKGIAP